jgi:hypothetical protein
MDMRHRYEELARLLVLSSFANLLCIHWVNLRSVEYVNTVLKVFRPTVEHPVAALFVAQDSDFVKVGSD